MKGIILHAGHGTRLRPLTHTGPKQLLPIANKPMSQYCLESLIECGVKEIAIIIGGIAPEKVQEYYGDGSKFGIQISYIYQDKPLGIAHAVNLCREFVGNEKFIVFLGDNILIENLIDHAEKFSNSNFDAKILLCEVDNPSQFGIAEINDDGSIKKIIEKPRTPPSNLAVTGIYFFTPKIFEIIKDLKPSWRNELEITDALQKLVEQKCKINYSRVTNNWKDTGTPQDIIFANKMILTNMKDVFLGEKDKDAIMEGKIIVGKNTIIKSGTKIIGPVIIGNNCIINNGAQIGPNTSIGDHSEICQCKIKDSIVMSNCIIDGDFTIKDSIIALNSRISKNRQNNDEKIFLMGEGTKISL